MEYEEQLLQQVKERIRHVNERRNGLSWKVEEIEKHIDSLNRKLSEICSLSSRLSSLEGKNETFERHIAEIKSRLSDDISRVDGRVKNMDSLINDIKERQKQGPTHEEIDSLKEEISGLSSSLQTAGSESKEPGINNEQLESLKNDIASLESEMNNKIRNMAEKTSKENAELKAELKNEIANMVKMEQEQNGKAIRTLSGIEEELKIITSKEGEDVNKLRSIIASEIKDMSRKQDELGRDIMDIRTSLEKSKKYACSESEKNSTMIRVESSVISALEKEIQELHRRLSGVSARVHNMENRTGSD